MKRLLSVPAHFFFAAMTILTALNHPGLPLYADTVEDLRALKGKYIHDRDIFDMAPIRDRFKALVGRNYKDLIETFMVVTPYRITRDIFWFSGHSKVTNNDATIAIDLKNNIYHAIIVYDSGKQKIFTEDMEKFKMLPQKIQDSY